MIAITPRITATLYKGHLPIAFGHLEPKDGKTWLAVAVVNGYTRKGYGTRIVIALCKYADEGGGELWLTCPDHLKDWYSEFGFEFVRKDKVNYMKRVYDELFYRNTFTH